MNQVCVSPDGHYFVTGSDDFTAKVWDCLAEGTRVTLASGASVEIERVRPGDVVFGRARGGAGVVQRRVQAVLSRGMRPCVELLFADGRTLICTANHRILTANDEWIEADNLQIGQSRIASVRAPNGSHCFHVPLIGKREAGIRRVWDLAVPSGAGDAYDSFVANGTLVHNCQRLEKNVTNRSRLTFSAQAKVKAITTCENSHSVAVGCDNGSVQIFRVEYGACNFSFLFLFISHY